ncbi:MAG TPA: magnesium transporter [Gemmatimonadales bacterium]|jgi:magnesium transporter|nr:magnesium transporter [Gemmatimonadales bacterium]
MQPLAPRQIIALLRDGRVSEFLARTRMLEPADLADVLAVASEDERVEIAKLLPPELTGEALIEMPEAEHAEDTLAALSAERAADIVQEMPDDDAADLLGDLSPAQQRRILSAVDVEERREVERLLEYDQESAGGLMTGALVTVGQNETVRDALESIRKQAEAVEDFTETYVVDDDRRLAGVLGFKRLVLSAPDRPVRELMEEPDVTVGPEVDQEEVARLMARYNVPSIPVVDRELRLLGRITFDDVSDVVEQEATEDLLRFGGVSAGEDLGARWFEAVKTRLPWLIVNLLTAFVAAAVVAVFTNVVRALPALAAWMTIISGMGGNAGTQTLAVTVRRLALGLIAPAAFVRVIGKEVMVGLACGIANGVLVALVAMAIHQPPMLGVVVCLAMTGNLFVAGFAGAFIPLLLERFRIDPAIASSVFVTTFTDVCGFALLLGLGGWLLL